jgi:hypothetical protein
MFASALIRISGQPALSFGKSKDLNRSHPTAIFNCDLFDREVRSRLRLVQTDFAATTAKGALS